MSKSRSEPCLGTKKRERKNQEEDSTNLDPFRTLFPLPAKGIDMRKETARDQARHSDERERSMFACTSVRTCKSRNNFLSSTGRSRYRLTPGEGFLRSEVLLRLCVSIVHNAVSFGFAALKNAATYICTSIYIRSGSTA